MNEHPVPFDWDDFYMREHNQQVTVPFAANSGITSVSAKGGGLNRPVPVQVKDPSVLSALWVAIKRLPAGSPRPLPAMEAYQPKRRRRSQSVASMSSRRLT